MRPLLDQVKQHRRVANVTIFWLKMAAFKRQVLADFDAWRAKRIEPRLSWQIFLPPTTHTPSLSLPALLQSSCQISYCTAELEIKRHHIFFENSILRKFLFFPSRCRSTFFWGPINQSFLDQNWNGGGSSQPGPEIKNAAAEVLLVCHRSRLKF